MNDGAAKWRLHLQPSRTAMAPIAASQTDDTADTAHTDEPNRKLHKLREQADAMVDKIRPRLDAVSTFVRDEPTKALLISAAAGAAIMGLVALLARSRGRRPVPGGSTLASIRDAALDLADRAHSAAADAIDASHQRANDAARRVGDAAKRASDTAAAASDTVSDAWKSLREHAAPVIDRVRPQLEAAANYAKED